MMDTKRFNDKHASKSRAVCERIEREDAERRGKLADLMDAQLKGELGRAKAEADGWRKIAERRLKHTDECEAALAKRNGRISKLEKQVSDLRAELASAKVLSERERKILDGGVRMTELRHSCDKLRHSCETTMSRQENDAVAHPAHYTQGGIECIDAMRAALTHDEFVGYLRANVLKYIWRYDRKGAPVEDLRKASWYLDRLTREVERDA